MGEKVNMAENEYGGERMARGTIGLGIYGKDLYEKDIWK